VFVRKKKELDFHSKNIHKEIRNTLGIKNVTRVSYYNFYLIENISEEGLDKAKKNIFSELETDESFYNIPDLERKKGKIITYTYLPGQYDQRADSALQCIDLILPKERNVTIKTGKAIVLFGKVTDEDIEKIKKYYINPVDSMEVTIEEDEWWCY